MEYYTTKQLTKMLGVSAQTIKRWAREGLIPPPTKLGQRSIRWPRTTIDKWLATKNDPAVAKPPAKKESDE